MTKLLYFMLLVFAVNLSGIHCKEVYTPPAIKNNPNLLVVDGIVVSGNDSTNITLSRTRSIADSSKTIYELNAVVSVVGISGVEYPLAELGNGRYATGQLLLDANQQYQLKIITSDGNEFRSEPSSVMTSPPIDSLYWNQDSAGVHIYLNTQDPNNNTHFYRWSYVETYEYHSEFNSTLEYINPDEIIPRSLANQIFRCYISQNSSTIEVANTSRLSSDIVDKYEIAFIPTGSIKMTAVYSNLVSQYAIPEQAFNFWQNLKKNTEQLGSLFDLQPFTELGNIHCMSNPETKSIGFISFTTVREKRIFINKNQVYSWKYYPYYGRCEMDTVFEKDLPSYFSPAGGPYSNSLIGQVDIRPNISPYIGSSNICVDCMYYGGSTVKPSYWP